MLLRSSRLFFGSFNFFMGRSLLSSEFAGTWRPLKFAGSDAGARIGSGASRGGVIPASRYDSTHRAADLHRLGNDRADFLRRLDKVRIRKVGIACGGPVPPMTKQFTDQRQVLARHDCLTGGGMAQVVQAQAAELASAQTGRQHAMRLDCPCASAYRGNR